MYCTGAMHEYPRNLRELDARFATEYACRDYLAALRWPDGFRCPRCGGRKAWRTGGLRRCVACQYKASLIAGTIRTDDWSGYGTLPDAGFGHIVVPSYELKIAHLGISLFRLPDLVGKCFGTFSVANSALS